MATELKVILGGLASSDNTVREENEKTFENTWMPQPSRVVMGLTEVLVDGAGSEVTIRVLAAIILRRIISKVIVPKAQSSSGSTVRLWNQLSEAEQQTCCVLLLNAWQVESVNEVRSKMSDVLAEIARIRHIHDGQWPELLQMLWSVNAQTNVEIISAALRIISAVPEILEQVSSNDIASYIGRFFSHSSSPQVRVSSLKVLHSIITCSNDEEKSSYKQLFVSLPSFLQSLAQEEDSLRESLECIVELTDDCPKLFRSITADLLSLLAGIVKANGSTFEEDTCSVALELFTCVIEVTPSFFRKQRESVNFITQFLLSTISENLSEDDEKGGVGEWYEASPDDENEEESLSLAAEYSLDRTALALQGAILLQPLMTIIPQMLKSADWRHRYAALRAIANMAEGCADLLADRLADLLSLVWPAFQDSHPRVQYAACHALGQLCTDFAGPLQETYPQKCLSHLVGVLVSATQSRVQCHAAAALINFAEGVDSALLAPFLDDILQRLVSLLNSPIIYLQEQVIATMAAFSAASGKSFAKYVDQIIPLLLQCLSSNLDRQYRPLQCRALEAATSIINAVGRGAVNNEYLSSLINQMVALQQAKLEDDDLMKDYLSPAWVRICQVLGGKDFVPFIPLVLPPLLEEAAQEAETAVIDAANPSSEDNYDPNQWDFATVRGRRIGINTVTLENKCAAVENLSVYIATLEVNFSPYVQQTLQTILPLISYQLHQGVQCAAAETIASLIKVFFEASGTQPQQASVIKSISNEAFSAMTNELSVENEPDSEIIVSFLDAMADIVKVSINIIPDGFITAAFKLIDTQLSLLVASRTLQRKQVDEDEDEDEENRDEDHEDVIYAISRFAAALFQTYKADCLSHCGTLVQFCLQCLAPASSNRRNTPSQAALSLFKHAALCIFDDLVHYLGAATEPIHQQICQSFTQGLADPDADCRQAAAFGIGMCSTHAPSLYEAFSLQSLPQLMQLVNSPHSKAPSCVTVTDNCVSAIIRIATAYSSPNKVPLPSVLPTIINGLPVTHDEDEAPVVYRWIIEKITNGEINIQEYGLNILHACVEAIIRECLPQDLIQSLKAVIMQLQSQLPPAQVSQTLSSSFTPEQLAKISTN